MSSELGASALLGSKKQRLGSVGASFHVSFLASMPRHPDARSRTGTCLSPACGCEILEILGGRVSGSGA